MDATSNPKVGYDGPQSVLPELYSKPQLQFDKQRYRQGKKSDEQINLHGDETCLQVPTKHFQVPTRTYQRHSLYAGALNHHLKTRNPRSSLPTYMQTNSMHSRRRAVLIAATYTGTKGISEQSEKVEHILNLFSLLTVSLKFRKEDVWVLTDVPDKVVGCTVKRHATRPNILASLKWLVSGSRSGDTLFFGFSGLCATVTRTTGKGDISEDCLLPTDYPASSPIPEREVSSLLIKRLHVNASLTAVVDARDPSKVLKLPYTHAVQSTSKSMFVVSEVLGPDQKLSDVDRPGKAGIKLAYNRIRKDCDQMLHQIAEEKRDALASAYSASGKAVAFGFAALPSQHQKILRPKAMRNGALTQAFVNHLSKCIADNERVTYESVLLDIALATTTKRSSQLPQISSSRRLDVRTTLALLGG